MKILVINNMLEQKYFDQIKSAAGEVGAQVFL